MPAYSRRVRRRLKDSKKLGETKIKKEETPMTPSTEVAHDLDAKTQANPYGGKTRQEWWETRFPEVPVLYKAQDASPRDVRNFVFDKSYLLERIINTYKLKGNTDEETAYKCCVFLIDNLKYVGDDKARDQPEFWQYPEDTLTRQTGDCEDGAILMKSLTLCAGVPDWKVKIQAGMVKGGGHAYCTIIRDDDTQCILDWCYWPNKKQIKDRPAFKDEPNYHDIWFSFNHNHSYAETKTTYFAGKVREGADMELSREEKISILEKRVEILQEKLNCK